MSTPWYAIDNAAEAPSPALLVYPDRIRENISRMIALAGGPERLRPHVKTSKTPEVVTLMMQQGIAAFKCATIAEAEMLAEIGARDITLALQPVGPTVDRLVSLCRAYPQCNVSTIADNPLTVTQLSQALSAANLTLEVFVDVDNGLHRTGIAPDGLALELYRQIADSPGLRVGGLHVYDGHLHDPDTAARKTRFERDMAPVRGLRTRLETEGLSVPRLVAGGCSSLKFHADSGDAECSAGTAVLWDFGFGDGLPELEFLNAAVLLTRVVSRPGGNRVCVDLGIKAVASEMPHPRVRFLGIDEPSFGTHNEEHLVFETPQAASLAVGDVLYALPRHICPTVSLHEKLVVVEGQRATQRWTVRARRRRLTI